MGRRFEIDDWKRPSGFMSSIKMAYRALDISLNEIMMRDINKCLKNEGEFGYKGINIHLVEPNETIFQTVEFNKCKEGVKYGTENYHKNDKKGLRRYLNEL